ncbi:MAG: M23 family metallopeptidase [Chitinophagaceae bacterium]|nr:M23 family metallopeptidase [Chitinophagaceae bacterium]
MELRVLLLTPLLFFTLYLEAQVASFPKHYFRNPLGIPMQLVANLGELRPDHWHMGLDIRTDSKENLPVYAAAEGYISHIGVRPQSFGRFIIVNHPNGLSTLYAHLNDFFPALEQFVNDQQYKQESWAIELDFTKEKFPVYKSQFIAYSGNTGGSQGPHLHFEIFETKTEKRINPLLFDFQLRDKVPPTILKLALYDRSKSVFEQTPLLFSLKNTDTGYIIPKQRIIKTGLNKISFAIQAYDKMSATGSADGIYSAKLYLDDEPQVSFALDSIDYDESLYINAHIDYRYKQNGGSGLQHLSILPGGKSQVYHPINGDGIIALSDTSIHLISIYVKDALGNTSQLNFSVQYNDSLVKKDIYSQSILEFSPNTINVLEKPDFKINLPVGCLYDTLPIYYFRNSSSAANIVSAIHQINDASYPVHEAILVSIKPDKIIPEEWKSKLIMQRTGKGSTIRKVTLQNGWLKANFGDFGTFQVIVDLTSPLINELGKGDTINLSSSSRILFTPTDNYGIVKNFRVTLDSQWICFTNDKSRNWIYRFDERCPYGVHRLTATATDLAGNSITKSWWFKREPYTPPPPKKKAVKKAGSKKKKVAAIKKPVKKKGK